MENTLAYCARGWTMKKSVITLVPGRPCSTLDLGRPKRRLWHFRRRLRATVTTRRWRRCRLRHRRRRRRRSSRRRTRHRCSSRCRSQRWGSAWASEPKDYCHFRRTGVNVMKLFYFVTDVAANKLECLSYMFFLASSILDTKNRISLWGKAPSLPHKYFYFPWKLIKE